MNNALLLLALALAADAAPHVLTLDECIHTALEHQPRLLQAHAASEVGRARADGALAPMLPQLGVSANYSRATANVVSRAGSTQSYQITGLPAGVKAPTIKTSTPDPSNDSYDAWTLGANANILVFDFGRSFTNWSAAREASASRVLDERQAMLDVVLDVRTAFFAARAQEALVEVQREALANEERHLRQVDAYVEVGRRPQIDLAQARGSRANAELRLLQAENAAATARARLFQAMGVPDPSALERTVIANEEMGALSFEDARGETLVDEARAARPDVASVEKQIAAQELALAATMAAYAPSLAIGTGVNDAGQKLDALTWNWNAQVTLTWSLFSGGATLAQQHEATANLDGLHAAAEAVRLQLRFEIAQAQQAVRAAKATQAASAEAVTAAQERHRLAEGRYEEGEGSALELSDAQLSLTTAEAQRVQADFDLSSARARLLNAMGR